jgi:hypothetical protein
MYPGSTAIRRINSSAAAPGLPRRTAAFPVKHRAHADGASFAGALDRERLTGTFVRISAARGYVARERCQDQK